MDSIDRTLERVTELLRDVYPEVVSIRRDLHRNPELSGEERRTAERVASRLRALGLEVMAGVGGHGVVALLEGQGSGPTLAYRADMDALPIADELNAPYRSQALGIKHACGHDAHVAIALGVASILSSMRDRLAGRVKFVFQPAEESLAGAEAMLADGALGAPEPEAILALHMSPMPVGMMGVALGPCLSGAEEFRVSFSEPADDLPGMELRVQGLLQGLRMASEPTTPEEFAALLDAMEASDVHSQTVHVSAWPGMSERRGNAEVLGLASVPDQAAWDRTRVRIAEALDELFDQSGFSYELASTFSLPPLSNDSGLVERLLPLFERIVGAGSVRRFRSPYPFSHEDFALFAMRVPALFFWLGSANPEAGIPSMLHTGDYDIDERVLGLGVLLMSTVLLAGPQWAPACE